MKGYKVFNPDWTCRGFAYKVGKTYELEGDLVICKNGFHFCKQAMDCFNYYEFDPNKKVAEVEALGEIIEEEDKCCTNKIRIVREITWEECLRLVNTGKGNSGNRNSGNRNSGNWNSGDCNSGNHNSGDCNSGNCNSGNWNSGNHNSGNRNSGNHNSGNHNSGNCNSGNHNSGDCNSGDFNLVDHETGCFCTMQHKIRFFDVDSDITFKDWRNSRAYAILQRIRLTEWIDEEEMTEEEKVQNPDYETTGGYLKKRDTSEAYKNWWDSLSDYEKEIIRNIPNFDANKFLLITGIDCNT